MEILYYRIYGMAVSSCFLLDAHPMPAGNPDIAIRAGDVSLEGCELGLGGLRFSVSAEKVCLHWDQVGSFAIYAHGEIIVSRAAKAGEKVFQRTLTGAVLAVATHQRGAFVLHASAVAINGRAVVFAGPSGFGKSTLAAGFHARGYGLLADDVTVIEVGECRHDIHPGIQEFKLWPDSVQALGRDERNLARFHPDEDKRLLPAHEHQAHSSLPLDRIYMLEIGEERSIAPLSPSEGAIHLISHTYGVSLLHSVHTALSFSKAVRLAQSTSIYRLQRTRSFIGFEEHIDMILDDLAMKRKDRYPGAA